MTHRSKGVRLLPGVYWDYDLTAGVAFMLAGRWRLRAHVLVLGPLAFCVLWRVRDKTLKVGQ